MSDEPLTGVKARRAQKIVNAALDVFVLNGYNKTSMEAIAEQASISKVTLYSYFEDKDKVFEAVAKHVTQMMETRFSEELDTEGSIQKVLPKALIAKFQITQQIIRQSPHAQELFATKNRLVAEQLSAFNQRIEDKTAGYLSKHLGLSKTKSAVLAESLLASTQGIANHYSDFSDVEKQVVWCCEAYMSKASA